MVEIWTPGFYKGRDSAGVFKAATLQEMLRGPMVRPWVDLSDLRAYARRTRDVLSAPLVVPVMWPNVGWIGDYYLGHGFAPFLRGGAITNYDGIINARAGGKAEDVVCSINSQTTVAANWSSFYRSGGMPSAGSYTNIPGGAAHNQNSAGAWDISSPGATDKKYLLSVGVNHLTGTNIVLVVDLLVAAGNINANATGSQTVNSVAQTRQYGSSLGLGVMMSLEVTTALGATGSNVTVNSYTNSGGTAARTTAALAMTASCIAFRLQPVANGWLIPLAAGDLGVRSVEAGISFSAAMGAGVVALLMFKPLMFVPTIATTTYVERDSTLQVDGLLELVKDGSNNVACLTNFVLTSTTSTGVQTYFVRTCAG